MVVHIQPARANDRAVYRKTDVRAASPLFPVAISTGDSSNIDLYSLFFQSAAGSMKFTNRGGLTGTWDDAL